MNETTPQPNIDKEVLLQAIKDTQWQVNYHTEKLIKHTAILEIYRNQLNQLN